MGPVIAMLFSALIMMMAVPRMMGLQQAGQENAKMAATAQQFKLILAAAQTYVSTFHDTLETGLAGNSSFYVAASDIVNAGMLDNGFSTINPYGQAWGLQVHLVSAGVLEAIVSTSGGTTLDGRHSAYIASLVGANGGFVPYDGMRAGLDHTYAVGAFGGWLISMGSYANPGAGHLIGLLGFNNGAVNNNYLYRVAVPGHPELNTMQTNIAMADNSISNVNNIQAHTGTFDGGNPPGTVGGVQVGGAYIYGDTANAAVRTPVGGAVYIQNTTGASAPLNSGDIYSSGAIGTNSLDPNGGTPGYTRGIHTTTIDAENGLIVSQNGGPPVTTVDRYGNMSTNGIVHFYSNSTVEGSSTVNGTTTANGAAVINGTTYAQGNVVLNGQAGTSTTVSSGSFAVGSAFYTGMSGGKNVTVFQNPAFMASGMPFIAAGGLWTQANEPIQTGYTIGGAGSCASSINGQAPQGVIAVNRLNNALAVCGYDNQWHVMQAAN